MVSNAPILEDVRNILSLMNEIVAHYECVPEDSRLLTGLGQLEFARTRELILHQLQRPPATILDVGGASGIYSQWLGS